MLIFVHIPKTAGTSFKNILRLAYKNSEIIVIDSDNWHKAGMYNEVNRSGLPGSVQIKPGKDVKCIVGHFNADRFMDMYPDATYITWLRDPIQRLISQHNYYMRLGTRYGEINNTQRKYDLIDLKTYCTHPRNLNSMKQQINIPLSKFKFIGIVEKYDEEVVRFKKITGIDLNNTLEHLNVNPLKKNVNEAYTIDEDLKQTLIKLHSEDYELYNKSLQIAGY